MLPFILIAFILGLFLGGLGTKLVHRLPRRMLAEYRMGCQAELGLPVDEPREVSGLASFCPHCGHQLTWWETLPLIGYLAARGKCRHCEQSIGWRYPVLELGAAAICATAIGWFGVTVPAFLAAAAGLALLWLAAIDLTHTLLPEPLLSAVAVLGLSAATLEYFVSPGVAIEGGLAGFLLLALPGWLLSKLRGVDVLGGGDPLLMAAIGTFIGAAGVLYATLAACVLGLLYAGLMALLGKKVAGQELPLGHWLVLGGFVVFTAQQTGWL